MMAESGIVIRTNTGGPVINLPELDDESLLLLSESELESLESELFELESLELLWCFLWRFFLSCFLAPFLSLRDSDPSRLEPLTPEVSASCLWRSWWVNDLGIFKAAGTK